MSENEIKVPDVLEEYFNKVERELEILQEETVVNEKGIKISVEPDGETIRGWSEDPYFKVFRGNDRSHIARIYITRAQYCKHHKNSRPLVLSSHERDIMIELLSRNNYEKWKKLLNISKKYIESKNLGKFSTNLRMPDYSKL